MEYAKKVAETPPADNTNTANTANTPPEGWRNPWRGAAIGGTFGGLLTTALGYLYGHRGRWLAYDALAGGLTGGSVGYAVDSHNNEKAEQKKEHVHPLSMQGRAATAEDKLLGKRQRWEKLKAEKAEIDAQGGFPSTWESLGRFGLWDTLKNQYKEGQFVKAEVDKPTYEDTTEYKLDHQDGGNSFWEWLTKVPGKR